MLDSITLLSDMLAIYGRRIGGVDILYYIKRENIPKSFQTFIKCLVVFQHPMTHWKVRQFN